MMNYTKMMAIGYAIGLLTALNMLGNGQPDGGLKMQPIIKNGCYYYNEADTHVHIDSIKAMAFLKRKLLDPERLLKKIRDCFYAAEIAEKLDPQALLNPIQTVPGEYSIEPKITWIGHATFLIQINGFNILTDPIFGSVKCGPITISQRVIKPGIKLQDLPPIHVILISHNHPDHTDTETLQYLAANFQPVVYVPKGNGLLVHSMGFEEVIESNWWEKHELSKDGRSINVSCLPAYHWSIRFSLSGYRKSLWSSWMISTSHNCSKAETQYKERDKNIYFAGDTAYGPHFKQIAAEFSCIDVALMPIGPTSEGENKHPYSHVDAIEAVDAFIDLNAHCFIPMHYGTFSTKSDSLIYPLKKLRAYWQDKVTDLSGFEDRKLLVAQCGNQYVL